MKHKFTNIVIKTERIKDITDQETYYWTYACVDNEVKIIGKSKTKPLCQSYDVMIES